MNQKEIRQQKRSNMFSLSRYLQTNSLRKAEKKVHREAKRQAKLEALGKKPHVHNEECDHKHDKE